MSDVAIVDNGGANIASLRFALERLECRAELTSDARAIAAASHVHAARRRCRGRCDAALAGTWAGRCDSATDASPCSGSVSACNCLYESSEEDDARCLGASRRVARRLRPRRGVRCRTWAGTSCSRHARHLCWRACNRASTSTSCTAMPCAVGPWTLASDGVRRCVLGARRRVAISSARSSTRSAPARAGATILRNFLALD